MKMGAEKSSGRKLKVRWTTEKWTPAIKLVVGALRGSGQARTLLSPVIRIHTARKKKQAVWLRAAGRINGNNLPGLNGSRTTWR